jgi:hypothetical protein
MVKRTTPKPKRARMSRVLPATAQPGRREEDPMKAWSKDQLTYVGAVALLWNQVEVFIDWLLYIGLKPPLPIFFEVTRRISGLEGRLDILRLIASRSSILDNAARECIKYTLDGVAECRTYRNNIVHSTPFDIDKGIGTFNSKAKIVQTLVTVDALSGLYRRLQLLMDELREIDLLYRLADEAGARSVYADEPFDPIERRRTHDAPIQTQRAIERQTARKGLLPLPNFPDEDFPSMERTENSLE